MMANSRWRISVSLPLIWLSLIFADEWCLLWEDDFNGSILDEKTWDFEEGDGCHYSQHLCGWGNNELQWYTKRDVNVRVENGNMIIAALQPELINGMPRYTSARVRTKNRRDWKYGKVEIRAKIPKGKGIWPALWMLPTNSSLGEWPQSGEIDIMEVKGHQPNTVIMAAHFGNAWNNKNHEGAEFTLPSGDFSQDFHVFKIEWKEGMVEWFIDGQRHMTLTNKDVCFFTYPFNEQFHLLINVAIGGNFGGNPDASTEFPQMMYVDYVRVHQRCEQLNKTK